MDTPHLTNTLARSSLFCSAFQSGGSSVLEAAISAPLRQRQSITAGSSFSMLSSSGVRPPSVLIK